MKPCFHCGAGKRYKTSSYCYECFKQYQNDRNRRLRGVLHRECVSCGVAFVASHGKQTRCSKRCGKPLRGGPACRLYGDQTRKNRGVLLGSPPRVFQSGPCHHCGGQFTSQPLNGVLRKYCSKPCERAAQPRRHKKFRGETRTFIPVLLADPCAYCGAPSAEIEHIMPRARGGENTWDNLTGACVACNARKSAKSLLTFLLGTISTA